MAEKRYAVKLNGYGGPGAGDVYFTPGKRYGTAEWGFGPLCDECKYDTHPQAVFVADFCVLCLALDAEVVEVE